MRRDSTGTNGINGVNAVHAVHAKADPIVRGHVGRGCSSRPSRVAQRLQAQRAPRQFPARAGLALAMRNLYSGDTEV